MRDPARFRAERALAAAEERHRIASSEIVRLLYGLDWESEAVRLARSRLELARKSREDALDALRELDLLDGALP